MSRVRTRRRLLFAVLAVAAAGATAVYAAPRVGRWMRSDREEVDRRIETARVVAESGDLATSERQVREALALRADDPAALALLGQIQEAARRDDDAQETFRRLLRVQPGNAVAPVHLARATLARGDAEGALRELASLRAAQRCPAAAHEIAARAELLRGRLDEALEALRAAAAAAPGDATACADAAALAGFLAETTWSPKLAAEASASWDEAARRAGRPPPEDRAVAAARAAMARGDTAGVLSLLAAAPAGARARAVEIACLRAAACAEAGSRQAAEAEAVAAWSEEPEPRLVAARCWALAWAGDVSTARDLAESARGGGDEAILDELARVPSRVESACDLLALGLAPSRADAPLLDRSLRAAAARADAGPARFARFLLRLLPAVAGRAGPETLGWIGREMDALAADPRNLQRLLVARAALDLAGGRVARVLTALANEPEPGPGAAEYRFVRGLAQERAGRFDMAVADLTRCVELSGDEPVRLAALVRAIAESGDVETARARAGETLARRPGNPWLTAACRDADRSAAEAPGWKSQAQAIAAAAALLEGTPDAAALAAADEKISAAESSPRERRSALRLRARLHLAQGDLDGALERARLLAADDPGDEVALDVIRRASAADARRIAAGLREDDVESRLRAAAAFSTAGERDRALALLQAGGDDPRVLRARARLLAAEGRFVEARRALAVLLEREPADFDARLLLEQVRESMGESAEAARGYRDLMASAPEPRLAARAAMALLGGPAATADDADAARRLADVRLGRAEDAGIRDVILAYESLARGDHAEALRAARRCILASPAAAEPHVVAALALQRGRDWQGAREEAVAALLAAPAHPAARRLLATADMRCGVAAHARGDGTGACASFERAACSGEAINVVASVLLAQATIRAGDAVSADATGRRLAARARRDCIAPLYTGIVQRSRGLAAEAARTLSAAHAVAPSNPLVLCAAVEAEIGAGRPAAAAELCRRQLDASPDTAGFTSYLLGRAQDAAGERAAAAEAFGRAAAASPRTPSYHAALVRCLLALGRSDEARSALAAAAAAAAEPDNDTLASYGRVIAAAHDADASVSVLVRELHAYGAAADRLADFGELQAAAGDVAGAEESFRRAVATDPGSCRAQLLLAGLLFRAGRAQEARSGAEAAVAARPEDPVPPTTAGVIAEAAGDRAAAERWYRRAIEASKDCVVAKNNLACLLAGEAATRAEALQLSRDALAAAPHDPVVLDTRAWLLHLDGNSRTALPLISRAARLLPGAADVRLHEAEILATCGRKAEARAAYAQFVALAPKPAAARVLGQDLERALDEPR